MELDFAKLIHAAIKRKYDDYTLSDIKMAVAEGLRAFRQTNSERALLQRCTVTKDFNSDVINHARCFYAIEKYWRHTPPRRGFVRKVHAVSYGIRINAVKKRTDNYVPDYGGLVLCETQDIDSGLKVITRTLSKVEQFSDVSASDKGIFLAELFAEIIRVHPFQDGNGRTARMLTQYCLRYWGNDYIIVPKVRNNKQWKNNLEEAVQGRFSSLSKYFTQRIKDIAGQK